jgi:hypothetical protein
VPDAQATVLIARARPHGGRRRPERQRSERLAASYERARSRGGQMAPAGVPVQARRRTGNRGSSSRPKSPSLRPSTSPARSRPRPALRHAYTRDGCRRRRCADRSERARQDRTERRWTHLRPWHAIRLQPRPMPLRALPRRLHSLPMRTPRRRQKTTPRHGRTIATDGHTRDAGSPSRSGNPAVRAAGLDFRVRVHDLRHPHASWLLAGGADVQVVKERLGHGSLRTTEIATPRSTPRTPRWTRCAAQGRARLAKPIQCGAQPLPAAGPTARAAIPRPAQCRLRIVGWDAHVLRTCGSMSFMTT